MEIRAKVQIENLPTAGRLVAAPFMGAKKQNAGIKPAATDKDFLEFCRRLPKSTRGDVKALQIRPLDNGGKTKISRDGKPYSVR